MFRASEKPLIEGNNMKELTFSVTQRMKIRENILHVQEVVTHSI